MADNTANVLTVADLDPGGLRSLLQRLGLSLEIVAPGETIPGSFWGDSEAGLIGRCVYARDDTPIHSVLHETGHVVCMSADRRAGLDRDAGGDDLEEAAVCYLQVLLADELPGAGRDRIMQDMDAWGYSFRLGSTAAWFHEDADDARRWLLEAGLVGSDDRPTYSLRD